VDDDRGQGDAAEVGQCTTASAISRHALARHLPPPGLGLTVPRPIHTVINTTTVLWWLAGGNDAEGRQALC